MALIIIGKKERPFDGLYYEGRFSEIICILYKGYTRNQGSIDTAMGCKNHSEQHNQRSEQGKKKSVHSLIYGGTRLRTPHD